MRRNLLKVCFILLAVVVLGSAAAPAFGQSATTGSLGGTIYDQNGAVLSGAEITATNAATAETRTTRSGTSGEYKITNLPPGTYTVTVTDAGFETYKANQVPVVVGSLSDVAPKLTVGQSTETVEVTDEAPLMHTQSSEISTVIDQSMIDNLPVNGRRYSNFALLTPGVVTDQSGFGYISFRGVNYLLNNATVDGLDNNQAYYSIERGGTIASYSFALAAVQEFQVNNSNYSAEYGRAAGGVINTVTRSGGNNLHGELYFFDRDDEFGATNPYSVVTQEQPAGSGLYATSIEKTKDWRKTWGFGLGGPLLRDKLFFFYAYDQQRRNYPAISRFSENAINAGAYAPAVTAYTGHQNCNAGSGAWTTSSGAPSTNGQPVQNQVGNLPTDSGGWGACQVAHDFHVTYAAGVAYYLQGLGIIQSFTGLTPRRQDQMINFPRLDWQINEKNRLTLEYNRFRASGYNNQQSTVTNTYSNHTYGNNYVKADFGIMRLSTVLSDSLVNELRFQFGRDLEYNRFNPPGPNEVPLENSVPGVSSGGPVSVPYTRIGYTYDPGVNYFRMGSNRSSNGIADPNERRLQAEDIVTWTHGKHTTKAGLDINRVFDYENDFYDENGYFTYNYSAPFIADYLHATEGLGGTGYTPQYYESSQGFGNPSTNIATTDYAGFLTDDWRITPHLTLTFGIRYEYEYIPPNPTPMTASSIVPGSSTATPITAAVLIGSGSNGATAAQVIAAAGFKPDDRNNVEPRIGFSLDVYGNGKTYLRGGYGIYNGRIINGAITGVYNAQISKGSQQDYETEYADTPCLSYPQISHNGQACGNGSVASLGFGPDIYYFNKHMQVPQVHEIDLAVEQQLGKGTVFQVMYMASLGRELESATDQNNACAGDFASTALVGGLPTGCTETNHTFTVINSDALVAQTTNYVTYPHGGRPSPMAKLYQSGQPYTVSPFFPTSDEIFDTFGGTSPYSLGGIYKVNSNVTSSYNALAVQLSRRMSRGLSFNLNYTWSHSLDYNPFIGNGTTFGTQYDPTNLKDEYGNGQLDVRDKFNGQLIFRPQTHLHGWVKYIGDGWSASPIVKLQTGLPYTPAVIGGLPTGAYNDSVNGSGGNNYSSNFTTGGGARLLPLGRNQYYLPKSAVVDLKITKYFYFPSIGNSRPSLELGAQAFNLFNHQNITQMQTTAYCINTGSASASNQQCPSAGILPGYGAPSSTNNYLVALPNYGTYANANSTLFNFTSRELEFTAQFYF